MEQKVDKQPDGRLLEWRVFRLHADLEAALEASGGEVTPEVEAIEKRLAENIDKLADAAVAMRQDAKAQQEVCAEEKRRLTEVKQFHARREAFALRLLRLVAEEKGPKYRVGSFTVTVSAAPTKVVELTPLAKMTPEIRADLEQRGLLRYAPTVDKNEVKRELQKGNTVPCYALGHGEKKVGVR